MRTDYIKREKENVWYRRYHRCATRYLSTLSSGTMTALRTVPDERYYHFDPGEYVELWGGLKLGGQYIRTAFNLPIYETAAKYQGPALIIHGNADRVVPYTYGERFHKIWPKSELVIQEYFDHGFSQNLYRTTDIVSDFLIKHLK